MLAKLAEGIPVDGMEALLPVLRPDDLSLLTDHLAAGTPVLICDPEKVRTRAADLIKTGREFLEASWSVAALGADAPIDVEQLGGSGFARAGRRAGRGATRSGHPWWTLSQLSDESAIELDIRAAPSARGHQHDIDEIFAMLRAHVTTGGLRRRSSRPGTGTAHRVVEQLAESDTPPPCWTPGPRPRAASSGCSRVRCTTASCIPGAKLVVITETDLTGNRATAVEGKRLAAKRRNVVDPLALTAGDLVVHDQHGIGRFVEMVERTVGGARREYLVLEYASSKRGGGSDKLFVPMDSLDQLSRYVGGQAPTLSRLGGSDWTNTKTKARKRRPGDRRRAGGAVRQAAGQRRVRVRAGHPVAGRDGGRVRVHRDRRPADRDHRGQVRHGEAGPDGPGDLRRRRLRQDRDRGAGGVQGGAGRQAGRRAGADDAAGRPAPADVHRPDGRVPGHREGAVAVHRPRRVPQGARRA